MALLDKYRGTPVFGFAGSVVGQSAGANESSWGVGDDDAGAFSDNVRVESTLAVGDTATALLRSTAFSHQRGFPTGSTPSRALVEIEGRAGTGSDSPNIQTASVRIFNAAGTTIGSADTSEQPISLNSSEGRLGPFYEFDVSSASLADLASASGVDCSFERSSLGSSETAYTIGVDSIRRLLYMDAPVRCNLRPRTPTTGQMAKTMIAVDVLESTVGDSRIEDVEFRYTVTGPEGWSAGSATERVDGVTGGLRNMATDCQGWGASWYADVAGTYTVVATMFVNDGGTYKAVTSNTVTFTIAADTRDVRYFNPSTGDDSNDGLTEETAWETPEKLETVLTNAANVRIIWADDTTIDVRSETRNIACEITGASNIVIERSGDGTNPPLLVRRPYTTATKGHFFELDNCTDFVMVGINAEGDSDDTFVDNDSASRNRPNFIHSPSGNSRLCLIDCRARYIQAFMEITSGNPQRNTLVLRCQALDYTRYGIYNEGSGNFIYDTLFRSGSTAAISGEGGNRNQNHYGDQSEDLARLSIMGWCETDASPDEDFGHSLFRHGWQYTTIFRSQFLGSTASSGSPLSISHNPTTGYNSFDCIKQFIACRFDESVKPRWGYDSKHLIFKGCLFETMDVFQNVSSLGRSVSIGWIGCTIFVPTGASAFRFAGDDTAEGLRFIGNLVIPRDDDAWGGQFFRNNGTRSMLDADSIAYNVLGDLGVGMTEQNTLQSSLANINGQAWATGNAVVAVPASAVTSAGGWKPNTTTYDIDEALTPARSQGCVCVDLRGFIRDVDLEKWNAGAVGEETSEDTGGFTAVSAQAFAGDAYSQIEYDNSSGSDLEEPGSGGSVTTITANQIFECRGDGTNASDQSTAGNITARVIANTTDGGRRLIGMSFVSTVDASLGDTVSDVVLKVGGSSSADADFTIVGVLADNPAAFSTPGRLPSAVRASSSTTASLRVEQDAYPRVSNIATFDQAAIGTILQEIIDEHGLAIGERFQIIFDGTLRDVGNKSFYIAGSGGVGLPSIEFELASADPGSTPEILSTTISDDGLSTTVVLSEALVTGSTAISALVLTGSPNDITITSFNGSNPTSKTWNHSRAISTDESVTGTLTWTSGMYSLAEGQNAPEGFVDLELNSSVVFRSPSSPLAGRGAGLYDLILSLQPNDYFPLGSELEGGTGELINAAVSEDLGISGITGTPTHPTDVRYGPWTDSRGVTRSGAAYIQGEASVTYVAGDSIITACFGITRLSGETGTILGLGSTVGSEGAVCVEVVSNTSIRVAVYSGATAVATFATTIPAADGVTREFFAVQINSSGSASIHRYNNALGLAGLTTTDVTFSSISESNNKFGIFHNPAGTTQARAGQLDCVLHDVALWRRALTSSEREQLARHFAAWDTSAGRPFTSSGAVGGDLTAVDWFDDRATNEMLAILMVGDSTTLHQGDGWDFGLNVALAEYYDHWGSGLHPLTDVDGTFSRLWGINDWGTVDGAVYEGAIVFRGPQSTQGIAYHKAATRPAGTFGQASFASREWDVLGELGGSQVVADAFEYGFRYDVLAVRDDDEFANTGTYMIKHREVGENDNGTGDSYGGAVTVSVDASTLTNNQVNTISFGVDGPAPTIQGDRPQWYEELGPGGVGGIQSSTGPFLTFAQGFRLLDENGPKTAGLSCAPMVFLSSNGISTFITNSLLADPFNGTPIESWKPIIDYYKSQLTSNEGNPNFLIWAFSNHNEVGGQYAVDSVGPNPQDNQGTPEGYKDNWIALYDAIAGIMLNAGVDPELYLRFCIHSPHTDRTTTQLTIDRYEALDAAVPDISKSIPNSFFVRQEMISPTPYDSGFLYQGNDATHLSLVGFREVSKSIVTAIRNIVYPGGNPQVAGSSVYSLSRRAKKPRRTIRYPRK